MAEDATPSQDRDTSPGTRWEWGVVALAVLASLAFGFTNLGAPSLWHDELAHVLVAKSIAETGASVLPNGREYTVGAVFNTTLAAVGKAFGFGEAPMRAPSVVVSAITVLLVYLLCRPLLGRSAAVLAAVLLALSPWSVAWARQARFYALHATVYVAFLGTAWRVSNASTPKGFIGWGIALVGCYVLSLFTSLHSVLFLGPVAAYGFLTALAEVYKDPPKGGSPVNTDPRRAHVMHVDTSGISSVSRTHPTGDQTGSSNWAPENELNSAALAYPGSGAPRFGKRMRAFAMNRGTLLCAAMVGLGVLTVGGYLLFLKHDELYTVTKHAQIGGALQEPDRADRLYYFRWLWLNLSRGTVIVAMLGFAAMLREGKGKGLFIALAFWVPLFALTFLIGYRRPRFMFFAYPFYVAALAYGLVAILQFIATSRRATWRTLVAMGLTVLLAKVALSLVLLTGDSLEAASGSDYTLARLHPRWRGPCQFVKDRLEEEPNAAVVATTGFPLLYYAGRIDAIFPARYYGNERIEVDAVSLEDVNDLKTFMAEHPTGYFITHWWRFEKQTELLSEDLAWVHEHMELVHQDGHAHSPLREGTVSVYRWDDPPGSPGRQERRY